MCLNYRRMADKLENESAADVLISFKNGGVSYDEVDCKDKEESPIPKALGLQRVGEESPGKSASVAPGPLLNRRGMPARIRKRNRLFYDDDVVNATLPRSTTRRTVRSSPTKKCSSINKSSSQQRKTVQQTLPSQNFMSELPNTGSPESVIQEILNHASPDRKISQRIGMRLRNLLKLPKAHKWVCYEWFYSNIDKALFEGSNDFLICLRNSFPSLKTRKLTRIEWCKIRRMMGKPRRCSQSFFKEERQELERRRTKIRLLQQRKTADVTNCKDLPAEIPLQLVIGTKVTARLRSPQDGLFTGSIDAVDTSNNTYRITFERNGLGTHSIPDYEVLSNESPETITLSSFSQKFRPRSVATYSNSRYSNEASTSRLSNDPLLSEFHVAKPKSLPLDGTLGGFPVEFLDKLVRLSKILNSKKAIINKLKEMNADAEKMNSFGAPIPAEFQRQYATLIIDLEYLNRDLQGYLNSVQKFCQQIAPEASIASVLMPSHLKDQSMEQAKDMVKKFNSQPKKVKNEKLLELITRLTAIALQVKRMSETEHCSYELKLLQTSMEEIKATLSKRNQLAFQNNVEVHMQHIQMGLGHCGTLDPRMNHQTNI